VFILSEGHPLLCHAAGDDEGRLLRRGKAAEDEGVAVAKRPRRVRPRATLPLGDALEASGALVRPRQRQALNLRRRFSLLGRKRLWRLRPEAQRLLHGDKRPS